MKKQAVEIRVNGEKRDISARPNALLSNILREELGLTGTKYGCGIGQCGACTVMVDGAPVLSCLTLAVAVDGRSVETVEGLSGKNGSLEPIQEAFLEQSAFQCGFCTPGMLIMGSDLLNGNSSPSEKEIREHIRGNICRCTGYNSIVRAILSCAKG